MLTEKLKNAIRDVKDFPKPGIVFKDITPIFLDAELCTQITDEIVRQLSNSKIDAIAGVESRGFFFGFLAANKMGIPFIPIRKAGKLPYKTHCVEYALEYGTAKIEMHTDAIKPGWKVAIHDDLLATGGTANAAAQLITQQGGIVDCYSFVVDLTFLGGKALLEKNTKKIYSIIEY